jgi:AhpD family alkylhydroperoxidase
MSRVRMVVVALIGCVALAASVVVASPQPAEDAGAPTSVVEARADIQVTLGFMPTFLKSLPQAALPGAWAQLESLQLNPDTALDGKTKELIGLAVASQVPCRYCIYAHTMFARANGATEAEIGEALAVGALTAQLGTFFHGVQVDEAKFRAEVSSWLDHARKIAAGTGPTPTMMEVDDVASARKDMEQHFGSVPSFVAQIPDAVLPAMWMEFRDVQLSASTALSLKQKDLISLGVASQLACKQCVIANTEFARFREASERELQEAVLMAGLTRHFSAMLNGLMIDDATFRKDIDRMVKHMKANPPAPKGKPEAMPPSATTPSPEGPRMQPPKTEPRSAPFPAPDASVTPE